MLHSVLRGLREGKIQPSTSSQSRPNATNTNSVHERHKFLLNQRTAQTLELIQQTLTLPADSEQAEKLIAINQECHSVEESLIESRIALDRDLEQLGSIDWKAGAEFLSEARVRREAQRVVDEERKAQIAKCRQELAAVSNRLV